MRVKEDYPQVNMMCFETRYSSSVFEVILNMAVSMATFLEWLLPQSTVQGSRIDSLVIYAQWILILIRK